MPDCRFCDASFDSAEEMHLHWAEHEDELNSHQKDELKRAQREQRKREEREAAHATDWKRTAGYIGAAVLIFGTLAVVGAQLINVNTNATPGQVDVNASDLSGQPMLGDADAPVTVVEFGDYRCPVCQVFEQSVFPRLESEYIETGQVKFYFLNYPFLGQGSDQAAEAAECVYEQDQNAFWDYHTAIYDNQGPEGQRWVTTDLLVSLAEDHTEVDTDRLQACIRNGDTRSQVAADEALGREYGVQGTPAVYVDGQLVRNWQSGGLIQVVEDHLPQ